MTDWRQAAQQALEALEEMDSDDPELNQNWLGKQAITDLRAALEQPEPTGKESLPVQGCSECGVTSTPDSRTALYCVRCIDKMEQPEQEPVAWRSPNASPPGGFVIFQQYPQALADLGGKIEPLYTRPPRREWQGLTDAELAEFSDAELGAYDLCLEVEAKLKEKNHD